MLQSYTDRYFIHKKIHSSAFLRPSIFLLLCFLIGGCVINQDLLKNNHIDINFLDSSFALSGSMSLQTEDGNFMGSYILNNGLDDSLTVRDIIGREVFSVESSIDLEQTDYLENVSTETLKYLSDWNSLPSILLGIHHQVQISEIKDLSVTYESYQILDSFQIPKKIIIIGIGYKATFTIKKLTFT